LVTSGYNNIPDASPRVKYPLINTGDGQGHLYVLNASSGAVISKIGTGVGSIGVPSGLAQISTWADEPEKNNTAGFTYGGDLLGNVWRFDINTGTVVKFAELKAGSGGQPITTRPELGSVMTSDGKIRKVVFIGSGKYLETSDLTDMQQQTLYAIKDDDTPTSSSGQAMPLTDPRTSSTMIEQTLTTSGSSRTASNNTVDFMTDRGWFVDLAPDGERQNVAAQLVLGTLIVPTTVPTNTVCSPGGTGWINYLNYKTGGAVDTSTNVVGTQMASPVVGINVFYIQDSNGKIKPVVSGVSSDNPTPVVIPEVQFSPPNSGFQRRRVIWRELIQ
jgi:type IV pilus assembly protein PilY1